MKFETGKTYQTRSTCDHDCIIEVTVLSRTPGTIKATVKNRGVQTFRPFLMDGVEAIRPWGRGSMMPIIDAKDALAPVYGLSVAS